MTHMQLPPAQPLQPLQPLKPETMLGGRYRLEREIGRGGMAIVWLARDLKLDRDVAVKVLLGELAFAMGPERFRREINVVSRLSHPHILPIDDYGELDGRLYYVMPFISGETLHKRLERERQLPLQEAVRIAAEVASALDYAHRQGIVHRDIKPENILLQNGEALVADFGIARAITEGGGAKLTSTGVTLGTPAYMSPEQASADPGIDGRSDIYSLGCVLYEMLAGQPPFSGPTAQAIIARHQLDEAPSLTIVRGTIPEEIEDVVMQALAKLPADRFANAGEFAAELKKILESGARPVTASERRRRATQTYRVRQKKSRRPLFIAAGVALALAIGAGAWAAVKLKGGGATKSRVGTEFDQTRIAVLYFDDKSGGELRSLADGLTEALIDELSAVKQLHVVSRNGVARFKGATVAPDSIQRALKVGTIVEGSLQKSGDRLRLRVSITDAKDGHQIGSRLIEKGRTELFALQDELSNEVATMLREDLGELAVKSKIGTQNAQAWEAYQKTKASLSNVDEVLKGGNVAAAVSLLNTADSELGRVEEMDKSWAAPIVLRGWLAHRKMQLLGAGDPTQTRKALDVMQGHAERAVALAPNDADALEMRATERMFRWLNNLDPNPAAPVKLLDDAEADYKAAVAADTLKASAWNNLSYLLNLKNRAGEAKLAAQRAYETDPYLTDIHKTIWRLFQTSLDLDVAVEARKWCAVGRERFPGVWRFTECQLWMFALRGQKPNVDSVWSVYREYLKLSPPNVAKFDTLKGGMMVGLALVRADLVDSAKHVVARSRGDRQIDPAAELVYIEALVHAQINEKDEALSLLTRYLATNPQVKPFAGYDESWWWWAVRDDPRYKRLVGSAN